MRIFGPKTYYVDNNTDVPPAKQTGTRRRPYGAIIQLAVNVKPDTTVKVCLLHQPGRPVVDFQVPGRRSARAENKE